MMKYTRMILEKQHPALENVDQPMFVYVLTMREHGPYRIGHGKIYLIFKCPNLGAKSISALNDYTQRIVALNDAIEGMNNYLHERKKPFLLGYFGDHQVAFDNTIPPKKGGLCTARLCDAICCKK